MTEVKPHLNWLARVLQAVCTEKLSFKICACSWDLLQACFLCGQQRCRIRSGRVCVVTWEDVLGLLPSQANLNNAGNVLQTARAVTECLNIACKWIHVCFERDPEASWVQCHGCCKVCSEWEDRNIIFVPNCVYFSNSGCSDCYVICGYYFYFLCLSYFDATSYDGCAIREQELGFCVILLSRWSKAAKVCSVFHTSTRRALIVFLDLQRASAACDSIRQRRSPSRRVLWKRLPRGSASPNLRQTCCSWASLFQTRETVLQITWQMSNWIECPTGLGWVLQHFLLWTSARGRRLLSWSAWSHCALMKAQKP